jgi:hypothetical protein
MHCYLNREIRCSVITTDTVTQRKAGNIYIYIEKRDEWQKPTKEENISIKKVIIVAHTI